MQELKQMVGVCGDLKVGINEQGIIAEKKARDWLRRKSYYNLQQIDWFVKKDTGEYFIVEAKHRELFKPPPFLGTGLDIKQLKLRIQIYKDLKIDTLLLVFVEDKYYYQFLSILEQTEYFDTKNNIRIYDIVHFNKSINEI